MATLCGEDNERDSSVAAAAAMPTAFRTKACSSTSPCTPRTAAPNSRQSGPARFSIPGVLLSGIRSVRDVHMAAISDDTDNIVAGALQGYGANEPVTLIVSSNSVLVQAMRRSVSVLRGLYPMASIDNILSPLVSFHTESVPLHTGGRGGSGGGGGGGIALVCLDTDIDGCRALALADNMHRVYGMMPGAASLVPFVCQAIVRQPESSVAGWASLYLIAMCEQLQTVTPRVPPQTTSERTARRRRRLGAGMADDSVSSVGDSVTTTNGGGDDDDANSTSSDLIPYKYGLGYDSTGGLIHRVDVVVAIDRALYGSRSTPSPMSRAPTSSSDRRSMSMSPPPQREEGEESLDNNGSGDNDGRNYLVPGMCDPSVLAAQTCRLLPALLTTVYCTCYLLPRISPAPPASVESVDPMQWFYALLAQDTNTDIALPSWSSRAHASPLYGGKVHTLRSLVLSLVLSNLEHTLTATAARLLHRLLSEAYQPDQKLWPLASWLERMLGDLSGDADVVPEPLLSVPASVVDLVYACVLGDASVVQLHSDTMLILCGLHLADTAVESVERCSMPRRRKHKHVPMQRDHFEGAIAHAQPRKEVDEKYDEYEEGKLENGREEAAHDTGEPSSKRARPNDRCSQTSACPEFPSCDCLRTFVMDRSRPVPEKTGLLVAVLTAYEEIANARVNSLGTGQPEHCPANIPVEARLIAEFLQSRDAHAFDLCLPMAFTWNNADICASTGKKRRVRSFTPVPYVASFPVCVDEG